MLAAALLDSTALIRTELALVAIALCAALFWPRRASVPLAGLEAGLVRLAANPALSIAAVFALGIVLRAALLPVLGPPAPYFPDEFSIILQGETFALGRLVNPTHPLAAFFESVYVIQDPAYASMYFPGRGAPLALGLVLANEPWLGVLLSMAALAGATVWMLRGWVSPAMALVGGILVVVRFGVLSGWINSYYGGGLIALGGVLVLGAYPRLMRHPRWKDGVALGLGLSILMISRPFEGLLFSAPFLVLGAGKALFTLRSGDIAPVLRMALPTVALTACGAALMLAYNDAATGDMLVDPYTHHRQAYAATPAFLFLEPFEPFRTIPWQLAEYYRGEGFSYGSRDSLFGLLSLSVAKAKALLTFYVGPGFLIPFLLGLYRARRQPVLLLSAGALAVGFLTVSWHWTQYFAPGFGFFVIVIMLGFSHLRRWRLRDRPSGLVVARLLACIATLLVLVPVLGLFANAPRPDPEPFARTCCATTTQTDRTQIIERLRAMPGRDLVIYRADRRETRLWMTMVANDADIDAADIVWAHDLGSQNQRLLDYYPDRHVWLVEGFEPDELVLLRPASQ